MNIFVLDHDPDRAARDHCDRHVVKMILETAQLLCGVHHAMGLPYGDAPYRPTHMNHPCAVWLRGGLARYRFTVELGMALCREYTRRYGKRHKSEDVLHWCAENAPALDAEAPLEPFAQAMPEAYRGACAVEAYRAYYRGEKARFATWKGREAPTWWA